MVRKTATLGIAWVTSRLFVFLLSPQPWNGVTSSVYLLDPANTQVGVFPAPVHYTAMVLPYFVTPVLSTVFLLQE